MTDRTHPDSGRITNPGATYSALPDEREAFEAMMRSQTFDSLKRLSDGSYESYEARVGWLAWNVRASHGQAPAPAYKDSTPELHIGDSAFESWYSTYSPEHKSDKQRARDAYAAGMGDSLVMAAPTAQPAPQQDPSQTAVQLAELVLSDCGHSSNYTPLLERVAARIDAHVERILGDVPSPAAQGDALDAERLDWLALAGPVHICLVIDRERDGEIELSTDDVTGYGKTLREAIDAARAAQEGK